MSTEGEARKRPARKKTSSASSSRPPRTTAPEGSDKKLYGGIAVVVAGLAALVWWSLPGDRPASVADEAGAGAEEPNTSPREGEGKVKDRAWERPAKASAEFAVVTDRPEEVVRKLATGPEIASRLEAAHCGNACDAVRKFMSEEDGFEIDITKTDDVILPPSDTMDTVAAGLTPNEREKVQAYPTSVVIRTTGNATPEALPARTAFAAAAVLADVLDGFVYDEVSRRIETAHDFASHTITAKLGEPAFARRQIVVQLYRQDDGTARVLTLGMARYGSPDISLRGANMSSGPILAEVVNTAASQLAHGKNDATLTITLDDVARVVGKNPAELNPTPGNARPVELDVVTPERIDGDPDNELAELVPRGGSTRENWDAVVSNLFGGPPSMGVFVDDKELAELAKRARRDLPAAIKRFQNGEGELFVKGPFPIPPESRVDGGASTEHLWIAASSCDDHRCTGILSNDPTYATNLAAGKTTSIERADAVDWVIHQRDGGTLGGESIKVLRARTRK